MVITKPAGVSFSSRVSVNLPKLHLTREVVAPSPETGNVGSFNFESSV